MSTLSAVILMLAGTATGISIGIAFGWLIFGHVS